MSRYSRKRKDKYGIYEIPEYHTKKKKEKKSAFSGAVKTLMVIAALVILICGVSYGVKYSMFQKGLSLYEEGEFEGAVELFEDALKPRLPIFTDFDSNVRLYLADAYVNIGEYGLACGQYNQIELWSDREIENLDKLQNIAYGLQLYDWGEYKKALKILKKAYKDGYTDLLLYVGSCYGQIGELDQMKQYYDIYLEKNEMNSFICAQYAAIALDEGNLEEAWNYIEEGKELKDQSNIKEILYNEIIYYEKMKDFNEAYNKAKAFLTLYPEDEEGKKEYDFLYTRQTES